MPGAASGRVTFLKVCHLPALRSREASSRVESMAWRTPESVRKAMGNIDMVCTSESPHIP